MIDTHEAVEWLRKIVTSRCDAQCTADLDSLIAELALKEKELEEAWSSPSAAGSCWRSGSAAFGCCAKCAPWKHIEGYESGYHTRATCNAAKRYSKGRDHQEYVIRLTLRVWEVDASEELIQRILDWVDPEIEAESRARGGGGGEDEQG